MQHTQVNFRFTVIQTLLVVMVVLGAKPTFSAGNPDRSRPDPLLGDGGSVLTGGQSGHCDARLDDADLVPGTDAEGNPVPSADLATGSIPLPGEIGVPLKGGGYVMVDGKKLEPLLNPKPSCRKHGH